MNVQNMHFSKETCLGISDDFERFKFFHLRKLFGEI